MKRNAFSLLEVIIATAVLAASAMVLTSLIGMGSKYGNRAEERTIALSQAESLLDEFLARLGNNENRLDEVTGELPGPPSRSFRISAAPFELGNATANPTQGGSQRTGVGTEARPGGLLRVTVVLFESAGTKTPTEGKSLIEISRLIRQPQSSLASQTNGTQADPTQAIDPSAQGDFP